MTYDDLRAIFTLVSKGAHDQARGQLARLPRNQLAGLAVRARTVADLADEVQAGRPSTPPSITDLHAALDRMADR